MASTATQNGTATTEIPAQAAQTPGAAAIVSIPKLELGVFRFRIVGDSPLITHAWSEKAKKQMRDKQTGAARGAKDPKNPVEEFENAFYYMPDGRPAIRTISFKAAAVQAATQLDRSVTKVMLRGAFHVIGELTPLILEADPEMREDMVRVGMGTADLRYRPEFSKWAVDLYVRVNTRVLSRDQLTYLFNQAGFSAGVGEWRPEKDGSFGLFHVDHVQDVTGEDISDRVAA